MLLFITTLTNMSYRIFYFIFFVIIVFMFFFIQACNSGGGSEKEESQFTISGRVTAAWGSEVDSDVNDWNTPFASNDDFNLAQTLSIPSILGGYVNQPGAGTQGRSFESGDISDIFLIKFSTGDTIVLNIANNFIQADLDLYLWDADTLELVDASLGLLSTEKLTIAKSGSYYVQVFPSRGASGYVLMIGQDVDSSKENDLRLSRLFVPGEVVVEFDSEILTSQKMKGITSDYNLILKSGGTNSIRLYRLDCQAISADKYHQLSNSETNPLLNNGRLPDELREKLETLLKIKTLRQRDDMKHVEPNYFRKLYSVPNDSYYDIQWNYPLIRLPEAWEFTTGSTDVIVAVIDTGILMGHPDLMGHIRPNGYDFISDPDLALDGDGIDADPSDPGDQVQGGSSFHGTHVSGTVSAVSDNNNGVTGVCWEADILPVRSVGRGGVGTSYDILQAVKYAAGLENDSGNILEKRADVINLSLGGEGFSGLEQSVYEDVRNAGVIVVAAAGNSASEEPFYPASYDGVISVSAVTIFSEIARYSNIGRFIDVAAPGGDFSTDANGDGYGDAILSTCGDDTGDSIQNVYAFLQGTSMAAPHISGVIALMRSVNPNLSPEDMDGYLQAGLMTTDLGEPGWDNLFGYGLIDAEKAVYAASQDQIPTRLKVEPTSLNFDLFTNSLQLQVSKIGKEPLSVLEINSSVSWIDVLAKNVDEKGLGTYEVTVNRDLLSDGQYSANLRVSSSINDVIVPVNVSVGGINQFPNVGIHYILLTDADSGETIDEEIVSPYEGVYEYRFDEVQEGTYQIIGGSDLDNDNYIGDKGEAYGAYGAAERPEEIFVSGDVLDADFSSGYKIVIVSTTSIDEMRFSNTQTFPKKQLAP